MRTNYSSLLKIVEENLENAIDPIAATARLEEAKRFRTEIKTFHPKQREKAMTHVRNCLKEAIAHCVGYSHPHYLSALFGE